MASPEPDVDPEAGPPGSMPSQPERVDRLATSIALLMAAISIISAVVAGRAAVWSSVASRADSLALQEVLEAQQIEAGLQTDVTWDRLLASRYDAPRQRQGLLLRRADEIRATAPVEAATLDLAAQEEQGVLESLWPFFRIYSPTWTAEGELRFDAARTMAAARAADTRLAELSRSATPALATDARARADALVAVAVLLVAALFFLTFGEVSEGRRRIGPTALGALLAGAAAALVVIADPDTVLVVAAVVVAAAAVVLAVAAIPVLRARRAALAGSPPEGAETVPPGDVFPTEHASEGKDSRDRFSRRIAVLLATATLLGACVGYLQAAASDAGGEALRDAQSQALFALTEHQRTSQTAASQVEIWTLVAEARSRAASARQAERYWRSTGDDPRADAAAAVADRQQAIASSTDSLTILGDDHPDGPRADPLFPTRFYASQGSELARRVALQDLANEAGADWGRRGAVYVAVLATIAIAAYLLGLSLILRGESLRRLFAFVGSGLLVAAGAAAAWTWSGSSRTLSAEHRLAVADAYARATVALESARSSPEWESAAEAYRDVIELHPGFARAHVDLASAIFQASSPQAQGYNSLSEIGAVRKALDALRAARAAGRDDLETRGRAGFYELLIGLADPESGATARGVALTAAALELLPDMPIFRFNYGAALLADGRIEDATLAYEEAIRTVTATTADGEPRYGSSERIFIAAGALTDLEIVAASRSDVPSIVDAIPRIKAAIVAGIGDPIVPERAGAEVTVSGLELMAIPSQLWWEATIEGLDPDRDAVSVVWYRDDPHVPGWHVLPTLSGPLRLGQRTDAGSFYEDGAAPDYWAGQGYLLASLPHQCVPDGRYRVELYVNGKLAAEPVAREVDLIDLEAVERRDMGLIFCRPADWSEERGEEGVRAAFVAPDGSASMTVLRQLRPRTGDAERPASLAVIDLIAAGWPGAPEPAPGLEPQPNYFAGLADANVMYFDFDARRTLKIIAGVTDVGIVLAVALTGSPEWVDSPTADELVGSFLQS